MGTIEKEETKQVIFKIRNEGSNPLVIVGTSGSCGCVVATFDKQPAEPGKALTLTVSMTPKESGFFQETIHVKCNTDQFIQLRIRGQVE